MKQAGLCYATWAIQPRTPIDIDAIFSRFEPTVVKEYVSLRLFSFALV